MPKAQQGRPGQMVSAEDDPVEYAIMVIESYQMDLRNSEQVLGREGLAALVLGKSLAEAGFCQGRIYTGAIERIRELAAKRAGEQP